MIKTIVGSFSGYHAAQIAVRELVDNGFMSQDISILASNIEGDLRSDDDVKVTDVASGTATGAVTGGLVGGAAGLAASLMGLAIPGIGPILAAGPLVAALSGAGAGAVAGGLIGALTEAGVPEERAGYYAESVRRGGALVTIKADDARAELAEDILRKNGAFDIDERVARWRDSGWEGWDPSARPYTQSEAERERNEYGVHADPLSGLPPSRDPVRDNRRDSTIRR